MRQILKYIGIAIAGFLLIQLVPYGRSHTNPPVTAEPQWDSPQTRNVAQRACFDCHSNETTWPWYSNVAPMSWLIQHDVDEGRGTMNLSEWGAGPVIRSERERGLRQADAQDISNVILDGVMPPAQYLILHPNADLSQAEREQLAKGFQIMLGVAVK
jgi:mono/diheme cytochrome c family protein